MRTKLLSSIVLGTMALAGVASADPYVRDHRAQPIYQRAAYQQPVYQQPVYQQPVYTPPAPNVRIDHQETARPTMYGFQISANGQWAQGYTYGNDPYVEGIARRDWRTLADCVDISGHIAQRVALAGNPYRSLEIQTTRGSAYVYTVGLIFADGHQETYHIKRTIDAQHAPNLRVDLGPQGLRGVNAVVVDGVGNTSFRLIGA